MSAVSASLTILFFLRECLSREENCWASVPDHVQEECQKEAVLSLPIATLIAVAKRALSSLSQGNSVPTQGRSMCCQAIHI